MTSEQLKKAMRELGQNQTELATRLDVDRRTINRYAAGSHAIPTVFSLAVEYLCSIKRGHGE
jgi:transcriptional regulator with XRE-family HTH domain